MTVRLAALLRPEADAPPRPEWTALLGAARAHGVLPLLADAAARGGWDPAFVATLRPEVAAHTAIAVVNERELKRVVAGLAESGVKALLLKGAHLAYDVYRVPELRPRLDTDLLVRDEDLLAVRSVLERLGYTAVPHVTGAVAFGQFQYSRIDGSGARHTIDVHWRIANPKAFATRLTYADLVEGSASISRLSAHAFAPNRPNALLVACLHRTAHHGSSQRLLWLYDVHLLVNGLSEPEWTRVTDVAGARGFAPVVAAALADAAAHFATAWPQSVAAALIAQAAPTDEDVLEFLEGDISRLRVAASDWRRLAGLRERAQFLREHLFPSSAYIKHRYGVSSRLVLPLLYTHRIVTGVRKWL